MNYGSTQFMSTKIQVKKKVPVVQRQPTVPVPTETYTENEDDVEMLRLAEVIRRKARSTLSKRLGDQFTPEELSRLESHAHAASAAEMNRTGITDPLDIRFRKAYHDLLSRICLNLDPGAHLGNTYLLPAVKSGEVPLENVPYMSRMEMFPAAWDQQIKKREAETQHVAKGPVVATTTLIKCPKCRKGMSYEESQTRSADESMTIKAQCLDCNVRINI